MTERIEVTLLKESKAWYQTQDPITVYDTGTGICAAIGVIRDKALSALRTFSDKEQVYDASNRLFSHIGGLLGSREWLSSWLVANGHTTREFLNTPEGKQKIFNTRLAWFNDMIKYWENYDEK